MPCSRQACSIAALPNQGSLAVTTWSLTVQQTQKRFRTRHGSTELAAGGLPPAAVERDHQLPVRSLTQRVAGGERLELADAVAAAEQVIGDDMQPYRPVVVFLSALAPCHPAPLSCADERDQVACGARWALQCRPGCHGQGIKTSFPRTWPPRLIR
jgi:hypothetical protein